MTSFESNESHTHTHLGFTLEKQTDTQTHLELTLENKHTHSPNIMKLMTCFYNKIPYNIHIQMSFLYIYIYSSL